VLNEDIMTPLMAKLSMTESYPFATPTESICRTPSTSFQLPTNASHQKLLLFVAGYQNTSLMVLLEKEAENDADLIHLLVIIIFIIGKQKNIIIYNVFIQENRQGYSNCSIIFHYFYNV